MTTFENPTHLTIGYWGIRGLGAPLRMITLYSGVAVNIQNYDVIPKEGSGYDFSQWQSVKPDLKKINPLMNLPYVQDGDLLLTQSNACLIYLAKKCQLLGSNLQEETSCYELLFECTDIREKVVKFVYQGTAADIPDFFKGFKSSGSSLAKLENWKKMKNPDQPAFFIGNSATAPDFHIWEMLDQIHSCAQYYSQVSPLEQFPVLTAFHREFALLPNNAKYFTSKLSKLPMNNIMAVYGATPTGAPFTPGMDCDWFGSSGMY